MRLVITSPSSTVYSKTKAEIDQPTHESLISEVQVLVFEDQKYRYRVPGISISSNMAQTTFTVLLKSTSCLWNCLFWQILTKLLFPMTVVGR